MKYTYKMSKQAFDEIVKARTGKEKNINPQDYVVKYVNDNYNLKGKCTEVSVH